MPKVQIVINQAGRPLGQVGISREDIVTGTPVVLTNNNNVGAIKWRWSFISVPIDSAGTSSTAALTGAQTATTQFTPDMVGTYLIQLTINDRMIGRIGVGVKSSSLDMRFPGLGETDEFGDNGWNTAINRLFAQLDGYNLNGEAAGGNLGGTYPDPSVRGITDGIGSSLPIGQVNDGKCLIRNGPVVEGGFPSLDSCYKAGPGILIDSYGAVNTTHELDTKRQYDIANASIRTKNNQGALAGYTGIDIDGYMDRDFASIFSRCKLVTADIGENLAGAVGVGTLLITDPVDLTTVSDNLLMFVELSGTRNGLFLFDRTGAAQGNIYELDGSAYSSGVAVVSATFYYPRFVIGSNTSAVGGIGPLMTNTNFLTFGGFDTGGSAIGHLHYSYREGGVANEAYTRAVMVVDDATVGSPSLYETPDGYLSCRRGIFGVAPIAHNNSTQPTVKVNNSGAGPSVMTDDIVMNSNYSQYIWIDLNSCMEDIGGSASWEMTGDTILNVGNAAWQSNYLISTIADGYQRLEISDWPEGMQLNNIEIDWYSTIAGNSVEMYAVRQQWPTASGNDRVNLPLSGAYSHIEHAGDSARHIDTFVCDQNQSDWNHANDKLIIILHASELGTNEVVFGIRLDVVYRSFSKWHTNITTNP